VVALDLTLDIVQLDTSISRWANFTTSSFACLALSGVMHSSRFCWRLNPAASSTAFCASLGTAIYHVDREFVLPWPDGDLCPGRRGIERGDRHQKCRCAHCVPPRLATRGGTTASL